MNPKRGFRLLFLLFLFVSFETPLLARSSGKIAGQVIDKETREPLPGVNVVVQGTSMGSATDADGYFVILNVPPGIYSVKASAVGYGVVVVSDVRVYIDQTSKVDFELGQETIKLAEVVVAAPRRVVKEDVSTSVAAFSSVEVRALPISSATQVATLQAGVESGLIIRGGGADQSLFLLDGVALRDPRNNQPITGVPLSAVQEISLERGGFNAEYGQLRSGIMNVVTKEGSPRNYDVTFTVRYGPPASKYYGTSPYDPSSMWLRPYLDPTVCWTGTTSGAWDYHTQRQYPTFEGWNAVSRRLLSDADRSNDLSPGGAQRLFMWEHRKREKTDQPDYNIDAGIGGPFPLIGESLGNLRFFLAYRSEREMLLVPLTRDDYYEDNWSLRLTSDIAASMKLDITATMGRSFNVAVNGTEQLTSTDYVRSAEQVAAQTSGVPFTSSSRIFLDSYYSLANVDYYSFSVQFTHFLTPKIFYDVRLERVARQYDTGPPPLRDTTKSYQLFPGYFVSEAPFGWSPDPTSTLDNMLMGGHTATARDHSNLSSTALKGNLTAQIGSANQVKMGIEFLYNDLNLDYGVVNLVFPESNNYVLEQHFPFRASAYIQDKLEFKSFIANLGLRLDYSNSNVDWPNVDSFDKSFFTPRFDPTQQYPTVKAKSVVSLSPRLGISHPITEDSKLYFNYGHFKQLPTYEQLLRYSRNVTGALRNIGDPDLEMANTIAYELGYDHSLFGEYLVQLAGFYRDIKDQQDFATYISNANSGNFQYVKPNNNSYQDIRGFEVTLRKIGGSWWNGFANFTYQVTKSGRFNRDRVYQDLTDQRKYDVNTTVLYQFRPIPRPYARVNVTFFTPSEFGLKLLGQSILGDWTLNVFGDWRDGGYTTWNPNQDPSVADNAPVVNYYNFNLRLSKTLSIGGAKITFFADVQNALNTKRLSLNSFYDSNDQQDYFNSLHLPASKGYSNIIGTDKVGDFRPENVPFQPVEQIGAVSNVSNPDPHVIYYEKASARYMNFLNNAWSEVDPARMNQFINDKAYIDMPNQSSFNFLNPRNYFIGITTSFEL